MSQPVTVIESDPLSPAAVMVEQYIERRVRAGDWTLTRFAVGSYEDGSVSVSFRREGLVGRRPFKLSDGEEFYEIEFDFSNGVPQSLRDRLYGLYRRVAPLEAA